MLFCDTIKKSKNDKVGVILANCKIINSPKEFWVYGICLLCLDVNDSS